MKRILFLLGLVVCIASCESTTENTMTVSGTIKGLKKGTLYLQHLNDSTLVVLDSLKIEGQGDFAFSHELETPEVFYLYLKKEDNNDVNDRIAFFGEAGNIIINTTWNTFDVDPEVQGSASHEKFVEFNEMISRFNLRELEILNQAQLPENEAGHIPLDSAQTLIDRNVIARYRYVLNFGLSNDNSYVTPYVVISEASDANPKYLDSIYKKLSPSVASSKYGKALRKHLEK